MKVRASAVYAGITASLFLGFLGFSSTACSSQASGSPVTPRVIPASTIVDSVGPGIVKRWDAVDGVTQNLVCLQALERGGPDYQGMLRELMNSGLAQPDATVLLPYAVNQCQ